MMTKTRTLTAVQPMLFLGECCKVTHTDRADWDAHHKTMHPSGKDLTDAGKFKPHIFSPGYRLAPIYKPTAKLRDVTLTKDEKEWLGKEVTLTVRDSVWEDGVHRLVERFVCGHVWSFGPNKTVSVTVYDFKKGHNVLESGFVANLSHI